MTDSNYHSGQRVEECHFCGDSGVEEHHVIPQRFDGPDAPENIIEVCGGCHKKLERLYDKSFYEWFGIDDEQGERYYHRECFMSECTRTATRIVVLSPQYDGQIETAPEAYRFSTCDECLARWVIEKKNGESRLQSLEQDRDDRDDLEQLMEERTVESSAAASVPEHTPQTQP